MKRIHFLLLGLLVSLTIAAVSPSLPPTRIIAGNSTVVVVTNGINNFTLTASGGVPTSGGSATNLSVYSSGTTNRPLRVFGTNGTSEVYVDADGALNVGALFTVTAIGNIYANSLNTVAYVSGDYVWAEGNSSGVYWGAGQDTSLLRTGAKAVSLNAGTGTMTLGTLNTTNLVVGSGAAVTKILSATTTLDFNLTSAVVENAGGITVTGAALGDVVVLGVPSASITSTVQYSAWVSAADTVTVRARTSAVGENPGSGTFRITVIKH